MPPLPRPKNQSPAAAVAEQLEWQRLERLRKGTWNGNGWNGRGRNANDGRNGGWRGNDGWTGGWNNDHWNGWTGGWDNNDWNTKGWNDGFWEMK